jgi:hypothetical protein
LFSILGTPSKSIVESLVGSVDENLLATVTVVKFLQARFKDEEEEWELMVGKAMGAVLERYGGQEVERVGAAIEGLLT